MSIAPILLITILMADLNAAPPRPFHGPGHDRVTGKDFATRSVVLARKGMAATSQPLATQAAVETLRKGGSAIDAAIAANAVLAVTEPTGCGLGGDLFAIVWDAKTGTPIQRLEGHADRVWHLAYAPDGHTLATAAGGGVPSGEIVG